MNIAAIGFVINAVADACLFRVPETCIFNSGYIPLTFKIEKSEMGSSGSKGNNGFSASQRDLQSIVHPHFFDAIGAISTIIVLAGLVSYYLYIKNRQRSIMNRGLPCWDPEKLEISPHSGDGPILALVNEIG